MRSEARWETLVKWISIYNSNAIEDNKRVFNVFGIGGFVDSNSV
ncbi:MAG: hypothetical protein PHR40_05460 [Bacteroidales bacterium]|nr:hypothetical protein [Bacteroidales bacterium]